MAGTVERVLEERPFGALLRLEEEGSPLLLLPWRFVTALHPGLRFTGFASLEGSLAVAERGVLYFPNPWFSPSSPPSHPPSGEPWGPLVALGLPPPEAKALWEAYGPWAEEAFRAQPYLLAWALRDFRRADSLLLSMGVDPAHPARLAALARYVVEGPSGRGAHRPPLRPPRGPPPRQGAPPPAGPLLCRGEGRAGHRGGQGLPPPVRPLGGGGGQAPPRPQEAPLPPPRGARLPLGGGGQGALLGGSHAGAGRGGHGEDPLGAPGGPGPEGRGAPPRPHGEGGQAPRGGDGPPRLHGPRLPLPPAGRRPPRGPGRVRHGVHGGLPGLGVPPWGTPPPPPGGSTPPASPVDPGSP